MYKFEFIESWHTLPFSYMAKVNDYEIKVESKQMSADFIREVNWATGISGKELEKEALKIMKKESVEYFNDNIASIKRNSLNKKMKKIKK